jgi:hypothetical protein
MIVTAKHIALFVMLALAAACTGPDTTPSDATDTPDDPTQVATTEAGEEWRTVFSDVVRHESLSDDVRTGPDPNPYEASGGWGLAFVRAEHRNIPFLERTATMREFHIGPHEEFAPYLILRNSEKTTPATFLVTAIVDYRQVEFMLDGKRGLLHEVSAQPATSIELPFSLGRLSPGAHDVQVVVIVDPYRAYTVTDVEAAYLGPEMQNLRTWRAVLKTVVTVEGNEEPARELHANAVGAPPPDNVPANPAVSFARHGPTHPYFRENYIRTVEGEAGSSLQFRTWTSRPENVGPGVHVIMMFVDYRQVLVNGEDVLVVGLQAGEEAILDTSITLPDTPGRHHLTALVMESPYGNMDHWTYHIESEQMVITVS